MAITVNGKPDVDLPAIPPQKIAQLVTATTTNVTSATAGAGWVDASGLSVTITPTSATSKILILTTFGLIGSGTSYFSGYVQLLRGSTAIQSFLAGGWYPSGGGVNTGFYIPCAINYVDSPASTSAQTYKIQINNISSANNWSANPTGASVQVIALEVLA